MEKKSAGLLMYRRRGRDLEVLLIHPGGPFWAGKDEGAWCIPKGEFTDEEPLPPPSANFGRRRGSRRGIPPHQANRRKKGSPGPSPATAPRPSGATPS
jgi:predicted NUDIX family NTP pyrophosphohydrolase